jgi:hypothetical protein
MYLKHERERLALDDKPLHTPGMGEPCAACGFARRYHFGIKGLGYLVQDRSRCNHFVPTDPNSKARRAKVIQMPQHVEVVSPVELRRFLARPGMAA